ncbi:MAG: hypothetical protein H7Y31_10990 [Chitinophagaceae bacterium]|nr:hypothetical protein [Chitinophagaceae bacterium]
MKSIGSLLVIFGAASIIFGFFDRVPVVLGWINNWGDTISWVIKIGMVILGIALYVLGMKKVNADSAATES